MVCFTASEVVLKLEAREPFDEISYAMLAKNNYYFQNHNSGWLQINNF